MSYDQRAVFRTLDGLFGKLIAALDDNGMRDSTLIIVTSDHGGHDTTHGLNIPEDMTIPWIIAGPGIQPMQLSTDVQIMDTAATAAYALHLQMPVDWQGVPVTEAFGLPVSSGDAVVCQ
jgi:arylsulfatase A-like enzyme